MRRLAAVLMGLGLLLGAGLSVAMLLPLSTFGLNSLVLVALAKLALAGSLGLIATGAVVRRLAVRSEQREALALGTRREVAEVPPSRAED